MIETFFAPEIEHRGDLWFQQDGATAYTAEVSMTVLRNLFPGRLISRFGDVPRPPRSPDLTAPDFFLWGYLKHKVFETRPRNLEELRNQIRETVKGVEPVTIRKVMMDFQRHIQQCIQNYGAHLKDIVFKK
jgi:hypothetical protein